MNKEEFYFKYLSRPEDPIPESICEILKKKEMMDEGYAIMPDQMELLLEPDKIKAENGCCWLRDGGAYIAAYHELPGATLEMYRWWLDWRFAEDGDSRYKIWCPDSHYKSGYLWNLEDCGCGMEDVYIFDSLRDAPERIGLKPEAMKHSDLIMVDGANASSRVLNGDYTVRPIPSVVLHFIYSIEGGIGIRSRFYKGYQSIGKGLVYVLKKDDVIPEESLWGLLEHNAREMAGLKNTLPDLYREVVLEKRIG